MSSRWNAQSLSAASSRWKSENGHGQTHDNILTFEDVRNPRFGILSVLFVPPYMCQLRRRLRNNPWYAELPLFAAVLN